MAALNYLCWRELGPSWVKRGKEHIAVPRKKILNRQKLLVNKGSGGGIVREIEKIIEIR